MQTYALTKTARTWDSYRESLGRILNEFNIMSVLEYGPGESTKIFQSQSQVSLIDTIEHNEAWAEKGKYSLGYKVHITIESNENKYPYVIGRCDKYNLIFIDGIARQACLMLAPFRLKKDGIVVLHDAERSEYKEAIQSFEYKFPVDDGHTMVMTNNSDTAIKLSEVLW